MSDNCDYLIDVSAYNQVTDWSAVRGDNIAAAWVKLSQGDYYRNPLRDAQVAAGHAAQMIMGGYHFADPDVTVEANLATYVGEARRLGLLDAGALLTMLDIENDPGDHITWTPTTANTFIGDWIRAYRAATGIAAVDVYANLSFWQTTLRPDDWADENVTLHVALYNGDPGNTGGWNHPRLGLHQHTDQGAVPGVAGNVDRNVTVNGRRLDSLLNGTVTGGGVATPPAPVPAAAPDPVPGGWVDYAVRSGDTLSGIAGAHGVSTHELAQVNNLANPDLIYVGQVLQVPAGAAPVATSRYQVASGDTLSTIAGQFGIAVAALEAANPDVTNPDLIYVGQVLDIPHATTAAPSARTYAVRSGDTLSGIAGAHGVSLAALEAANPDVTNPDLIYVGQVLRLP